MKTMRRSLAVLLAVILAFSSLTVAVSAAQEYNFGIDTKVFRYDGENWVEANGKVKRGEDVKVRVYISTDYATADGELVFGFTKDFLEYSFADVEAETQFTLNSEYAQSVGVVKAYTMSGQSGYNVARDMWQDAETGYIDEDTYKANGWIQVAVERKYNTYTVLDGDQWLFEIDMKVKDDADPEAVGIEGGVYGSIFSLDELVCNLTDTDYAYTGFAHANGSKTSPKWDYDHKFTHDDEKVEIINDITFFPGEDGKFADGSASFTTSGIIGEDAAPEDLGVPAWVANESGTSLAGWVECDEDGNVIGDTAVDNVKADYEHKYYVAQINETGTSTVYFDANEGAFSATQTVLSTSGIVGESYVFNTVPTRSGYTFKGWAKTDTATTPDTIEYKYPASNATYYAVWEANTSTIFYIVNGKQYGMETYKTDETINYPEVKSEDVPAGYEFDRWAVPQEGSTEYADAPETMPANSVVAFAEFKPVLQYVKYNIDGTQVLNSHVLTGENVVNYKPSEIPGYTAGVADEYISGWYTTPTLTPGTELTATTKVPAGGITLYAKSSIPATFDANGGKFADGSASKTENYAYGEAVTAPASTDVTKEGNTFNGWKPVPSTMGSTPAAYVAQWTPNTYAVTFTQPDGTVIETKDNVTYGSEVPELEKATLGDLEFDHWEWSDADGKVLDSKPSAMPAGNLTAKAVYKNVEPGTSKVSFVIDGQTVGTSDVTDGAKAEPFTPDEKEGQTFDKWYSDPECKTPFDFNTPITAPTTIYGKYNNNTYTVSYFVDGTKVNSADFDYKETIEPYTYKANGYKDVTDWTWFDPDGNELTEEPDQMPAYNLTAQAKSTPASYTITYKVDGDEYKVENHDFNSDITILAAPEKEGYTFSGWTPSTLAPKMPAQNLTVEGSFTKDSYKLEYVIEGDASAYSSEKVDFGSDITPKAAPEERTGYTFSGWQGEPEKMPANDVTVTGKFVPNTNDFTYVVDGENYKTFEDVPYGTPKSEYTVTDPSKEGYTFTGWSPAVPDTMPDAPVELTATFSKNNYDVKYKVDYADGNGFVDYQTPDSVAYGDTITLKQAPTKNGYTFSNWFNYPTDLKMPAGEVTVYGYFTKNAPTQANYTVNYHYMDTDGTYGEAQPVVKTDDIGKTVDGKLDTVPAGFVVDTAHEGSKVSGEVLPDGSLVLDVYYKRDTVAITWDPNDGTIEGKNADESLTENVYYGAALVAPTTSREGYTLSSWTPTPATATTAATYTAQWTPNEHAFKYDAGEGKFSDGSSEKSQDVDYDTPITVTDEEPTRDGYTFDGWQWNTTDGKAPETMPDSDVTATAKWKPNSYNATFYNTKDDSTEPYKSVPVNYGEAISNPGTPTKAGCEFAGWKAWDNNADVDFANEKMDSTTGKKYYAAWNELEYTVTYDALDGQFGDGKTTHTAAYKYGDTIESHEQPTKDGSSFEGWTWYSADGIGISAPTTMPAGNITAKANYVSKNKATFYVDYLNDAGTKFDETNGEKGSPITAPDGVPTKDGYTFGGWAKVNADGTITPVTGDDYGTYGDTAAKFTPVWNAKQGTATFNANGGTFSDGTGKKTTPANTDSTVSAPSDRPAKPGYDFLGWSTEKDATAPDSDLGKMPASGEKDYYAVYAPKQVDVEFDANGGCFDNDPAKTTTTTQAPYDSKITAPASTPTRDGYEFLGWSVNPAATTPDADLGKVDSESGEKVFAVWKELKYKIAYYADDPETPYTTQEYSAGAEVVTPTNPTIPGYSFNGWKWYKAADKTEVSAPTSMPAENLIAVAQLTPEKYTVTYVLDGGNIGGNTENVVFNDVEFNSAVPTCANPTKEGYIFDGWTPAIDSTMPAHPVTYTAKWRDPAAEPDTYTITYYNGDTVFDTIDVPEGGAIKTPDTNPSKFGNKFTGWKYYLPDGTEVEPTTMPASDLTAKAQFKPDTSLLPILPVIVVDDILVDPALVLDLVDTVLDKVKDIEWPTRPDPDKPTDPDEPTNPDEPTKPDDNTDPTKPVNPTDDNDNGNGDNCNGNNSDFDSPQTGSAAGIAVFSVISGAAAAAYVIARKKHTDDNEG